LSRSVNPKNTGFTRVFNGRLKEIFMRLSQYFLPVLKETPKEAQIASHRLCFGLV